MRVLVAAASRYGATAEIARAIADALSRRGLEVTLAQPEAVPGPLTQYEAVVLGSAVYTGHWLAPAIGLAHRLGNDLAGRPVWLFSSGPVGDPSRSLVQKMGADPVDVPGVTAETHARGHRVFAGRLERRNLRGPQRAALWMFRGFEGDFRDWEAIGAWADSIADELQSAAAA